MMNTIEHFPVIVIGTGPTGLTLANLLGAYGVRTLVLERNTALVDEPRAVSIDDESLRTLQTVGLVQKVLPTIVQGYGVHYFSWSGREFARVEPSSTEYGYPKRNAFRQAVLVSQLYDGLARFAQVDVRFEHEVTAFAQSDDEVMLDVLHHGERRQFSCDWLVACDGGRSPARERLGIALAGDTFAEKWLIVDLLQRENPFRHTRTYCDPARPAIRLPGPDGTVRYEFMLMPGETAEQVLEESQLRQWIAVREASDANLPIARKVVYTFHARIAERWRDRRVFLAGDAAHLTPPFAGQGMNSGLRDAANLAWKLAAVTKGQIAASLLDSYEAERKPHAWALIRMAILIGRYMQPKSIAGAMLAQWALKLCSLYPPARDYVLQLKFKPKPRFAQGFFVAAGPTPAPTAVRAGQLMPQPHVEMPDGSRRLLDDVLGQGFSCLVWHGQALTSGLHEPLAQLGARRVQVLRREDDFPWQAAPVRDGEAVRLVRDCDGVIEKLLTGASADAVVIRPDRYVLAFLHGAASDSALTALQRMLEDYTAVGDTQDIETPATAQPGGRRDIIEPAPTLAN